MTGKLICSECKTIGGRSRDRPDCIPAGRDKGVECASGDGDGDDADEVPSERMWVDSVGKVANVIGNHQMIVSLMVQSEKQMMKMGKKELAQRVGDLVQKLKRNSCYCGGRGGL